MNNEYHGESERRLPSMKSDIQLARSDTTTDATQNTSHSQDRANTTYRT